VAAARDDFVKNRRRLSSTIANLLHERPANGRRIDYRLRIRDGGDATRTRVIGFGERDESSVCRCDSYARCVSDEEKRTARHRPDSSESNDVIPTRHQKLAEAVKITVRGGEIQ
jgi:hypothetical protein